MSQQPPGAFIVGTGRCGSTLLSNILRQHPKVLSLSEFFMPIASRAFVGGMITGEAFWKRLSRPQLSAQRAINPKRCPEEFLYPLHRSTRFNETNLPPILYVTLPHLTDSPDALYDELAAILRRRNSARLGAHYRFLFEWLCRRFRKRIWVERSGGSIVMLPAMLRTFPDARIVHCHRDGRDVSISIGRHAPMRLFAANWHRCRRLGLDLLRPPLRVGDSRIVAVLEPLMAPLVNLDRQLDKELPLDVIGAFWSELIGLAGETLEAVPHGKKLAVRYEALIADPEAELTRLAAFLDLGSVDADWLATASAMIRRGRSNWQSLPPAQQIALQRSCQSGLRALNYLS